MFLNLLSFFLLTCEEFCLQSLETVVVFLGVHVAYKTLTHTPHCVGDMEDSEVLELDLSLLPESYAQTDEAKTDRILQLEKQVGLMSRQLLHARNQVNTLHSEVDKYKRVHAQVTWLIDQFRNTVAGATRDKPPPLEAIMPPPPPPLPPLVSHRENESESLHVTTVDLVTPKSSQDALVVRSEEDEDEDVDEDYSDDDYSDAWETTEGDDSGPSSAESGFLDVPCAPSVPTAEEITDAALLLNVTPRTHISELFRRLYPPLDPADAGTTEP